MHDLSDPQVAFLALACLQGHSRRQKHQWLNKWGSASALWSGPLALQAVDPQLTERLTAIDRWLDEAPSGVTREVLHLAHPNYPPLLRQTPDAPLVLFMEGQAQALCVPSLSLVGSRHASAQGVDLAHAFGYALARAALCVVSGLARGIDAAAHEGALSAQGLTVAVLGHGPDTVYPKSHASLAQRIKAQGCLLTEYPPGVPPQPSRFPERNRIIAGLSLGTLVVEAGLPSGSLGTARMALDFGREVMAVPGSVMSPHARGCHALIKQGAQLVECVDDVLGALNLARPQASQDTAPPCTGPHAGVQQGMGQLGPLDAPLPAPAHTDEWTQSSKVPDALATGQMALLSALGWHPICLETAAAQAGLEASQAQSLLLDLELNGQVARLPGAWLQRRH